MAFRKKKRGLARERRNQGCASWNWERVRRLALLPEGLRRNPTVNERIGKHIRQRVQEGKPGGGNEAKIVTQGEFWQKNANREGRGERKARSGESKNSDTQTSKRAQ